MMAYRGHHSTAEGTLAYAGALPFAAAAAMALAGIDALPLVGHHDRIAASYALAILSFMAGAHWGTDLYAGSRAPLDLSITSTAVAVAAWLTFLTARTEAMLMVAAAGFASLLAVDHILHRARIINRAYFRLRRNVTAIVIACLTVTAAL